MKTARVVNVASVPHRSPFRYPGGKTWLVPYIRRWLDSLESIPHQLSEPFAGGGIVGLSALFDQRCNRVCLVELDEDVAAVWKTILNGQAKPLVRKILAFDVSLDAVQNVLSMKPKSTLQRAFATIVRNRVQRGGIMASGASLMKNGENGRGLRSRWYPETLAKRILAIAELRESICFVQGDALQYLEGHITLDDTVFFIDPPYTVAGRRLYSHSEVDHERLFQMASRIRGDFLMTYDDAEPIRALAAIHDFDTDVVPMKNTHHSVKSELLIGKNLDWARSGIQASQNLLFKSR